MKHPLIFGLLMLTSLGGCVCPPVSSTKPVVSPSISSAAHRDAINARSAAIDTLRAKGKVTVTYVDKDGKDHSDTAEGILLLRRMKAGSTSDTYYKAVLFGRVAGQDVFELGENDKTYWMASRIDPKTAHVVKKTSPTLSDPSDPEASSMPIRAGQIPFLLGIAPVELGAIVVTNSETVSVISMSKEAVRAPQSQVELSRYSPGDPIAVRLYHVDGTIEGEAALSDYTQVGGVRLPHKIIVTYPARKAKIELTIDSPSVITQEGYELNPSLKDAAFIMPDFEKQGLRVNPAK